MKMIYGGVPVNSMKVKHYEISTSDCDMVASDLQAGKTAVARGKKITGTGKSFEFACYGGWETNRIDLVPNPINVIYIGSPDYPTRMTMALNNMKTLDFTIEQKVAEVSIDEVIYPIAVSVQDGILNITCDKTINIEMFYGKDNYV